MAALIIRIEELREREEDPQGREMIGFSISSGYDGELKIGDALPGVRCLLETSIKNAIDAVFGAPVSLSHESMTDAREKLFLN
jgi:hypothetical protein